MGNIADKILGPQAFPVPASFTDGTQVRDLPELSEQKKSLRRLRSENCTCPFLKTAYVQGKLNVNKVGYAPLQDCYAVMDWCGVGRSAFPTEAYITKFGLTGVPVLHLALIRPNDTGIAHPYITNEKSRRAFEEFVSFANSRGHMTLDSFRRTVNHYVEKYNSTKNHMFAPQGELVTLLTAFGRSSLFGGKHLTKKDVEDLWINCKYPEGWLERRKPETSRFSSIDCMMLLRFIQLTFWNYVDKKLGRGPRIAEKPSVHFKPRPSPPYKDAASGLPMTRKQLANVPGNYKYGIALYDSRFGKLQKLESDEEEFDFDNSPEWHQISIEECPRDILMSSNIYI